MTSFRVLAVTDVSKAPLMNGVENQIKTGRSLDIEDAENYSIGRRCLRFVLQCTTGTNGQPLVTGFELVNLPHSPAELLGATLDINMKMTNSSHGVLLITPQNTSLLASSASRDTFAPDLVTCDLARGQLDNDGFHSAYENLAFDSDLLIEDF